MSNNGKVLIIDKDNTVQQTLRQSIEKFGFSCVSSKKTCDPIELVSKVSPDIVLAELPTHNGGMNLLQKVKQFDPNLIIIILASKGTIESAIGTMKAGAFDYINKPFTVKQVEISLRKAIEYIQLHNSSHFIKPDDTLSFDGIFGKSEAMQQIFTKVLKISDSDANVMISGESGTGKELLARSIHIRSCRNSEAFIPVDCVALPENLLESELFGYEKGAFTGAESLRRGLLEYADRGTLFLDEICELAPNLQAKLLRVLQEREFRRVGGKSLIKVDLRIISATNKNPERAVADQLLREDLYYRLNVIPVELPPLRERREDVPLLVNHYLDHFGKSCNSRRKQVDEEVMNALVKYPWPGNVRELRNLIECVVSLTDDGSITLSDLPGHIMSSVKLKDNQYQKLHELPFMKAKNKVLREFEREYFLNVLKDSNGNISKAAHLAAVSRRTMYRMINTYNLHKMT